MNIDINFKDVLSSIEQEFKDVTNTLIDNRKTIARDIVKVVRKNVEKELPQSDPNAPSKNYDGTRYVHMRKDIKTAIRDRSDGATYMTIRGGKYTGYKWHMVNNGTSNSRATHFIDKAMDKSNDEINSIINDAVRKAVNNGK